jgi:hypothetical protein
VGVIVAPVCVGLADIVLVGLSELLADALALALADDDDVPVGDVEGFADFVCLGLAVVAGAVDGSTVLGLGLDAAVDVVGDGGAADELRCCTVLFPRFPVA